MSKRPSPLRDVSRRDVIRLGAAGMGLAALGPLSRFAPVARGAPTGDPFVVVVNLIGGNDGLNTVVPRTLAPYYDRRPTIRIPAGTELSLDAGPAATTLYGLHPAMPRLRDLYVQGRMAIVQRVGYPTANLSHFTSSDIYSLAVRGEFSPLGIAESGWIARFADLYAPTPMGAVSVGLGRPLDFVGGTSNPFLVDNLTNFRFLADPAYPVNHEYRLETLQATLSAASYTGLASDVADAVGQGLALADQVQDAVASYTSGVDYGTGNLNARLRDVATLVQYGFETRIYYTGYGGFDTHGNQGAGAGTQASLLERLDTAVGAFVEDVQAMGIWDRTVIVVISEFGRRNYQNGSGGTDHGHGNAFLVLGGAVAGGTYGPDLTEADLLGEWPAYAVDFRDVYREVLSDHLGADPAPVFPESQPTNTVLGFL